MVTNAAAYQFAALSDLKPLRARLLGLSKQLGLKGTILLSLEGVNLFVAGEAAAVTTLLDTLRAIPGLQNLTAKLSLSDGQPFTRMLVRIKKEIIAFGVPDIDPVNAPAPRITPAQLKEWLDEGRPMVLLDTRNDYEVRLGTFKNAQVLPLHHFRDFPAVVSELPEAMKERTVVTFCTGGIRCEKAVPYLQSKGYKNVFQLDGGILKYFEDCGNAHYEGECFVFDHRVGVDPALRETASTQCFRCKTPLTELEQADPRYVPGESCPTCHQSDDERTRGCTEARNRAMEAVVRVLPGSLPQDNFRPLCVPNRCAGMSAIDFLMTILPHSGRGAWETLFGQGLILDDRHAAIRADTLVKDGQRLLHRIPAEVEPEVSRDVRVLHEDDAVIVVSKPASLPVHSGGRYHRNTLQHWMEEVFHPWRPRAVHRLDANTSGLMVFAKTRQHASRLQPQFAQGTVEKTYRARIQGHPKQDRFRCDLPIGQEPRDLGLRDIDLSDGLAASTEFEVVDREAGGTSLLTVRPLTGRTNQIRLHCWALGHPIVGDPSYLPDGKFGEVQTLLPSDPPMHLHAWKLAFVHPGTRSKVCFEAPLPAWASIPGGSVPTTA
ncbi:MAG: sulfurtransferase [Verrucomicrobia bacterium]|nr:sulfurtransferase [Verrucomicrobiota bacterium]